MDRPATRAGLEWATCWPAAGALTNPGACPFDLWPLGACLSIALTLPGGCNIWPRAMGPHCAVGAGVWACSPVAYPGFYISIHCNGYASPLWRAADGLFRLADWPLIIALRPGSGRMGLPTVHCRMVVCIGFAACGSPKEFSAAGFLTGFPWL